MRSQHLTLRAFKKTFITKLHNENCCEHMSPFIRLFRKFGEIIWLYTVVAFVLFSFGKCIIPPYIPFMA
jgi:hypothetical protein